MDFIINSLVCSLHQNIFDPSVCMIISDCADLELELNQDYSFIVPDHHTGIISLQVAFSCVSQIKIYCASFVDLTVRLLMIEGHHVNINVSIIICGTKSNVKVLGLSALHDQQSVIIQTQQIHCGKNSQSSFLLQGLLTGKSQLRYDGMIRIESDASQTYALQNNQNILLSDTAHAVSIPNIEVLNHDVQCYHGAAIGRFDRLQMQYMQSRGLDQQIIKRLLVAAFCQPVLQGYRKKDVVLQTIYEKI